MSEATYRFNGLQLALWAQHASGGVLTITTNDYAVRSPYDRPSLRRVDGEALGHHEAFGERRPITGIQLDIYVSETHRLDRRYKVTLRRIRDAVRKAFYNDTPDSEATYAALRERYGQAMYDSMALAAFESTNHIGGN